MMEIGVSYVNKSFKLRSIVLSAFILCFVGIHAILR